MKIKRIAALLGAIILLLAFCSCGEKTLEQSKNDLLKEQNIELNSDETAALTEKQETEIWNAAEESKSFNIEQFWDILQVPMGWILDLCNRISFGNYLIALLLFTLVTKVALIPSSIKQQKNMVKQASFAPRERAIQKKYAGRTDRATQQQMQQELMDARREAGVSTFGGCLSMFLQFPILICLYAVIRSPLRYLSHLSSNQVGLLYLRAQEHGFEGLDEIGLVTFIRQNMEKFSDLLSENVRLPDFKVFGLDFSANPSFKPAEPILWALLIIPVLTFVSYYFSMKLARKFSYQPPVQEGQPDMQKSMKIMDWMMPLFSLYISFSVPALLGVYWIYQSAIGILQSYLLKKAYPYPQFSEEDYKEAERQYSGKKPKKSAGSIPDADPNRPRPRSLHHIDDDDEDELPDSLRDRPVSTKYGDEDGPSESPIARAPLKDGSGEKKKPKKSKKAESARKSGETAEADADTKENSEKPEDVPEDKTT